jgi:VWFA-related protein
MLQHKPARGVRTGTLPAPALPARWFLLWVAPLVLLLTSVAAATNSINVSVLEIDDSEFPIVRVTLKITDSNGRPISGLGTSAFTIDETGARASVSRVEVASMDHLTLGVVMVMDVSASMRGAAIQESKAAAAAFVNGLGPNDHVAVMSFSSGVTVQSHMTDNRQATLDAIARLQALGDTALYEAVTRAVDYAHNDPLDRNVIVLLSDGREFGGHSRSTRDQALAIAASGGVPFYVIGLGPDIDRPFLQELARQTNGSYMDAPTPASVRGLYDQIARLIREQYVVTLRSTAPAEVEDRNMRLVVITSAGGADVRVDYRTRREVQPPISPAPPPAAPLEDKPPPVATTGGGVDLTLMVVMFAAAVTAVVTGGLAYKWAQERRQATDLAELRARATGYVPARLETETQPEKPASEANLALAIEGPKGAMRFMLDDRPLTLGSGRHCDIRLEDENGRVAGEHARVWSNGRKVIYHELVDERSSLLSGAAAGWMSLAPGEEFTIGPYRVRIEGGRQNGRAAGA